MRIPFALAAGAVALACTAPPPPRATRIAVPVVAPARAPAGAPWSLTASDGSGLALVRVEARASVEGPLAFTELHLTFRNGEPREREGRFQLVLPPRAAIARFATEHAGAWQEAEVVPKALARRAYDDFLHRRQDPALLERAAGNQLTAKIFPIAANAEQRLVVAYSQELAGRYVLPLRGLPVIERIDVELAADGAIERLSERAWLPDRDFVAATPTAAAAVRAGGLVAAQVRLAPAEARDVPRALTLLVDTSASRALAFDAYVAAIHSLVRALPGDAALQVVAFDQDTEPVFDGRAAAFGAPHVRRLVARGAAGATDLGQAIARLRPHPRLVLVGDATITAGIEGDELAAAIARAGVARVDVALAGGLRDERAAARLAGGLPRAGRSWSSTTRAPRRLAEPVLTDVPVTVAGATWVYPRVLATARPGDTVVVYARTTRPTVDVRVGATRDAAPDRRHARGRRARGRRGRARRARGAARAAGRDSPGAAALRDAIAAKSVAARILSSQTALLVLERDADYARYGIPRAARGAPAAAQADAPDVDRDGVLDDVDGCPDVAAPGSPGADDGCPVTGRIVVADSAIHVLGEVYFAPGQAELPPGPHEILDAVAEALAANPEIALVEVQGHTDARGDAARNLALSERRARAVVDYLVARGVAAARLTARGYGATQPRAHRHAMNRRVAFLILRRDDDAPPAPPAPVTGELATIQELLAAGQPAAALARARAWRARAPGDVLALVGLGEALEAAGDRAAPRAPTARSSICTGPRRPAPLRGPAPRAPPGALPLELDTYRRAVATARSPHRPPPARLRARARRPPRRRVRRDPRGPRSPAPRRRLPRRAARARRGRRDDRRRARRRHAGGAPARRRGARAARPRAGDRAVDPVRAVLGDRRERRRPPRPRRARRPRVLRAARARVRRRALRRRHHRLRPRVLRARRAGGRALPAVAPLLRPGPDGLRHGRPRAPHLRPRARLHARVPPLRHHGRAGLARPRLVRGIVRAAATARAPASATIAACATTSRPVRAARRGSTPSTRGCRAGGAAACSSSSASC